MLPNCPQYVIAVFAVLRLGAIVVNINPAYTAPEVDVHRARLGHPDAVHARSAGAGGAAAALGDATLETIVITALAEYSPEATPPAAVAETCAPRRSDRRSRDRSICRASPSIADEDVAVLQYTGGTTGVPKAAMLTHRNIFANTIQTELWHHRSIERGRDRFLMVIPYFHIYGLTVGLMRGVWQGARQILIPKYDVEVVLAALRDYRPTYFPAVPTIFVSLLNHPRAARVQPRSGLHLQQRIGAAAGGGAGEVRARSSTSRSTRATACRRLRR